MNTNWLKVSSTLPVLVHNCVTMFRNVALSLIILSKRLDKNGRWKSNKNEDEGSQGVLRYLKRLLERESTALDLKI